MDGKSLACAERRSVARRPGKAPSLDKRGVDRPAKQHVATCQPGKSVRADQGGDQPVAPRPLIPFFDRAQAIRITLVADLPPSRNHRRQAARPKAA